MALAVFGIAPALATTVAGSAEEMEVVLREGTNFAAARSPVDGSLVIDLQGTLWHLDSGGGPAKALTDGLGDDRLPDISSDGTRVVFQSYRNGVWDIWMMEADGSNAAALTDGPFDDREPTFSPDGSRVAFSSDRSGNYDVWVLELETGATTRVTTASADDFMPAWTPGGDSLVYVSAGDRDGSSPYPSAIGVEE